MSAPSSFIAIRRLLLATDLSAASERAAVEAIRLAVQSDAHLLVLSVIDPGRLRLPGGKFLRRVDQERARIEAGVQQIVRRAKAAGVRATFLVWEGDAAEAILAASEAEDADVIVLGSHRRSSGPVIGDQDSQFADLTDLGPRTHEGGGVHRETISVTVEAVPSSMRGPDGPSGRPIGPRKTHAERAWATNGPCCRCRG